MTAAHHAQVVERLGEVVAVRRDQPALARGDVLRRVEREARDVGDRADLPAAVPRLRRVRGVLDDRQAELEQRVEVGRLPVEVDGDDRLRPLPTSSRVLGVDVERVVTDVREHRRRAAMNDHVRGRGPRDRARDHLVARARRRARRARGGAPRCTTRLRARASPRGTRACAPRARPCAGPSSASPTGASQRRRRSPRRRSPAAGTTGTCCAASPPRAEAYRPNPRAQARTRRGSGSTLPPPRRRRRPSAREPPSPARRRPGRRRDGAA